MQVGILRIVLMIAGARSLKEKRRVVKSLKDRLHNTFNVSVAEVDDQDLHQKATLGVSVTGTDGAYVNAVCQKVLAMVGREREAYIADYEMEVV